MSAIDATAGTRTLPVTIRGHWIDDWRPEDPTF
jgi:hypothetical protein